MGKDKQQRTYYKRYLIINVRFKIKIETFKYRYLTSYKSEWTVSNYRKDDIKKKKQRRETSPYIPEL